MRLVVVLLLAGVVIAVGVVQLAEAMRPKTVLVRFTNGPTVIGTVVVPVSR